MKKYYTQKEYAFTLAEVLITLMIIGILAMVTIPSLLQAWEERATVSQLRKTYSALQQAFQMTVIENGKPSSWDSLAHPVDKFIPYINILKDCRNGTGCMGTNYKTLNNSPGDAGWFTTDGNYDAFPRFQKVMLKDGVSIAAEHYPLWTTPCTDTMKINGNNVCAVFNIDVNGPKQPNTYGIDVFWILLTDRGFIATGGPGTEELSHGVSCRGTGRACARWVIERGNMDYLHKNTTW